MEYKRLEPKPLQDGVQSKILLVDFGKILDIEFVWNHITRSIHNFWYYAEQRKVERKAKHTRYCSDCGNRRVMRNFRVRSYSKTSGQPYYFEWEEICQHCEISVKRYG